MTTNLLLLAAFVFCMIIMSLNYRKRHHKIVFFGDLITSQGVGWKGYIRNLTEYLNVNDIVDKFDLVNAGVSGNTIVDLEARLQSDILANGADVVVIFIGINDVWRKLNGSEYGTSIQDFEQCYKGILTKLQQARIKCVLCTLPVIGERQGNTNVLDQELELFSETIRVLAAEQALPIVDLRSAFTTYLHANNLYNVEKGLLTHDGVHLNFLGKRVGSKRNVEGFATVIE